MSKQDNAIFESSQCSLIHLAAAALWIKVLREPSIEEVMSFAAIILNDLTEMASVAKDELGPHHDHMTQAECDTYGIIHDLLHPHHIKDYRTTALFPLEEFKKVALCFICVRSSICASLDVVIGENSADSPGTASGFISKMAICPLAGLILPPIFFAIPGPPSFPHVDGHSTWRPQTIHLQ